MRWRATSVSIGCCPREIEREAGGSDALLSGRQAEELAASRSRLVQAQAAERRRIERNIQLLNAVVGRIGGRRLGRDSYRLIGTPTVGGLTGAQHSVPF